MGWTFQRAGTSAEAADAGDAADPLAGIQSRFASDPRCSNFQSWTAKVPTVREGWRHTRMPRQVKIHQPSSLIIP